MAVAVAYGVGASATVHGDVHCESRHMVDIHHASPGRPAVQPLLFIIAFPIALLSRAGLPRSCVQTVRHLGTDETAILAQLARPACGRAPGPEGIL